VYIDRVQVRELLVVTLLRISINRLLSQHTDSTQLLVVVVLQQTLYLVSYKGDESW
jgi:hypothetical protein